MCLHVMWSAGAGERKNVSQSEKDQESQWSHRGEGRKENSNRKKIKSQLLYKATVITSTRALVVLLSTIVALHCQQPARVIPMGGNHHLLLVFVIAWWMSGKSLFPLPQPSSPLLLNPFPQLLLHGSFFFSLPPQPHPAQPPACYELYCQPWLSFFPHSFQFSLLSSNSPPPRSPLPTSSS